MSTLTVYDAQGNEYSPSGAATGTNQRIKEMALASMRVAIKPDSRQVTGYFRAKETPNSRAEQFYGEYTDRNTAEPLTDFVDAVRTQIDEWNHTLDESDDSMSVFNALTNQRRATVPGSEKDMRILEELAGDREVTAVGVSGANEAVGLLQEFADQHSVAIADSTNTDALSEFDIVIVTGRHQGIEPLGQTTGRWKEAKQSLKRELVDEEISSITESVRTLKRDFGLSSGEIQRKVSGLEAPGSGNQSSKLGSASTGGGLKQTLLSPQVGKYMFIGSIVLILIIGGLILFGGGIPILGSGGGDVVAGTVYNDTTPVAGEEVILKNGSNDERLASTTTNENGEFEFNTTGFSGPYTVESETHPRKENVNDGKTDLVFGEAPGILSGLPIIGSNNNPDVSDSENNESSADDSSSDIEPTNNTENTDSSNVTDEEKQSQSIRYVEGSVMREEDGQTEPVASAMVTLEDSEENIISAEPNETTQEGAYRIDNIEMNDFEGDVESGQIYIIAEKENQFIAEEEVDLSIRDSPYEITQTITVTEEDLV